LVEKDILESVWKFGAEEEDNHMQHPVSLEALKEEAWEWVGHRLPKQTFDDFAHPNNRLLVGVTCLRAGYVETAYALFASIAAEGPKENPNHHFAYVRSLVEMAEIDAERDRFGEAARLMSEALEAYPESMGYMMSRVHLEVYLAYYLFQCGEKESAFEKIAALCERERKRFVEMPRHDAVALVGPGLCYALHQWALFFAMEDRWEEAFAKAKEMIPFASLTYEEGVREAEMLLARGEAKEAFDWLISSIQYRDGDT
jgi:tetratricopeptide (TPR) repeat protein